MRKLNFELKNICKRNRDGSFSTQGNRERMLSMIADQLHAVGFKTDKMSAQDLKGRHVNRLVELWKADGVTAGTMKNRMAALRWWAEKVGNPGAVQADNSVYGIEDRVYVTNTDKAARLEDVDFSKLKEERIRLSVELQRVFGWRREEAMKFQPSYALDGVALEKASLIKIKDTWAKGGRPREIPILNEEQRRILQRVVEVAGIGSMIPPDRSYKQHLRYFEVMTAAAGIGRTHGLRHLYAQTRYLELTGFACPAAGGLSLKEKTPEQRVIDREARLVITRELGHGRIHVTSIYLGT